jgi:hypothetical protein
MHGPIVLIAAELHSPGFFEFLGALMPLETIRKYLEDRHERRKDNQYRMAEEARRQRLENDVLELDVVKKKLDILRELGATDDDLAPIRETLIIRPLRGLDQHQDSGVIEGASTRPPLQEELVGGG